jgi:hypothetical protein
MKTKQPMTLEEILELSILQTLLFGSDSLVFHDMDVELNAFCRHQELFIKKVASNDLVTLTTSLN